MKSQYAILITAIFALPPIGTAKTVCDLSFGTENEPAYIWSGHHMLESNNMPSSAEDIAYSSSSSCPDYVSITSRVGTYVSKPGWYSSRQGSSVVEIYGVEEQHTYPWQGKCLEKMGTYPPVTIDPVSERVNGRFIYCISGVPKGSLPRPKNEIPSPPSCACSRGETSTPNPVFLPTGEKYLEKTDWIDFGPHPLTIKRTYSSNSFGKRSGGDEWKTWIHNFDLRLSVLGRESGSPNYIRIINGGAKQLFFKKQDGVWSNTNGKDSLVETTIGWNHIDAETDETFVYDVNGIIQERISKNGWKYTYVHQNNALRTLLSVTNAFGKTITFDTSDYKNTRIKLNGETIVTYLNQGTELAGATYPDGSGELYSYGKGPLVTRVSDAAGNILDSFEYDYDLGRAVSTVKPLNAEKYKISYIGDGVKLTNPLGIDTNYTFFSKNGTATLKSQDKPNTNTSSRVANRSFADNGFIESEIDFRNSATTYEWDTTRRLPLNTTQASGTSDARTTDTEWHPQWRLPTKVTEAGRETSYTYDDKGNKLTQTITDTSASPVLARTWTWTYHPSGLVATEAGPNGAVTSFSYDSSGNLTRSTNALGQVDSYTHDGAGRVLNHTAPNGLVSTYQYDPRGRMTRAQHADQVTIYTYRPTGQVATVSTPSGYQTTYQYDAAQRLTGWSDNRGASASYTLDGMGNRVQESISDGQGQAAWRVASIINSLNRAESVTIGEGSAAVSTSYGYDANGDLIRSTEKVDGADHSTMLGLDPLRRVREITNAQNASAALEYNALDAVTKATDFKNVSTSYVRDALGNALQENSPDSGVLTSTYDSLGLPKSITDALGRATSITRDALGRPTQIQSTHNGVSRTIVLRYDLSGADYNAPHVSLASVGSLSEIQDPDVTTRYQRDQLGRVIRKTQVLASGDPRSVIQTYVPAGTAGAGQLASITYPSGKQLAYQYDTSGQLVGMTWDGQPLVTNLTWNPLGQPTGWQWQGFAKAAGSADPLLEQRSYTAAGQLASTSLLNFTWGRAGRVTEVKQQHMLPGTNGAQQVELISVYTYNPVGRLVASAHNGPSGLTLPAGLSLSDIIGPNILSYAWDANGNRLEDHYSTTTPAGVATLQRTYTTAAGTNQLAGYTQTEQRPGSAARTGSVSYIHDAAGAMTRMGDKVLYYGVDGRISHATTPVRNTANAQAVSYTYNFLGQRLLKSSSGATQQTVYAEDDIGSTVLGQYSVQRSSSSAASSGWNDSTEVVYLPTPAGPMPVAAEINGRLYAIESDHLNTPRRLTDQQGQVAWQWVISGFGEVAPTTAANGYLQASSAAAPAAYSEAVTFDLRYPGQQWDEETGLTYNLHRYYDAAVGRFVQSDPIGLTDGVNPYAYVYGNPLMYVDPNGLWGVANLPSIPQPVLNFTTGVADAASLGLGPLARQWLDIGGVDRSSTAYSAGEWASLGLGAGRAAYAGIAKVGAAMAADGAAALTFRNGLKRVMRGPLAGSDYRIKTYEDLMEKYGSDAAIKAAAGRTNRKINAIGADLGIGGVVGATTCDCP